MIVAVVVHVDPPFGLVVFGKKELDLIFLWIDAKDLHRTFAAATC